MEVPISLLMAIFAAIIAASIAAAFLMIPYEPSSESGQAERIVK